MADTIESLRETVAALRGENERLLRECETQCEHRDASDRRRIEVETQLGVAAAPTKRIAAIIAEAEADKTIPSDPHCGEAIVLRRIKDALR